MFALPIILLVIGAGCLILGTVLCEDDSSGLMIIFVGILLLAGSSVLFADINGDNAVNETKQIVLGYLDYENTVTLTPQGDGTYDYKINDSTSIKLYEYLTTEKEK